MAFNLPRKLASSFLLRHGGGFFSAGTFRPILLARSLPYSSSSTYWFPSSLSFGGSLTINNWIAPGNILWQNQKWLVIDPNTYSKRQTMVQIRQKHGGRIQSHLQKLSEKSNEKQHEAAVERREKKKEKNAIRKGKKSKGHEDVTPARAVSAERDDNEDDSMLDMDTDDEEENEGEEGEEHPLPDPAKVQEKLDKVVGAFEEALRKIRGGEPSADMFDDVMVDAYGEMTPLKNVAQVVISAPNMALATCYDPSLSKNVATAIRLSMEGLNPQESGEQPGEVRIPLLRPSMETRQATVKVLHKRTEKFRQKMRQIRRASLENVRLGVAGKLEHVSKDEAFRLQQEIEKISDAAMHKVGELSLAKEKIIMSV